MDMNTNIYMDINTTKNRYALVTGASRGIGKSIALSLAQAGYHMIITCKNSVEKLEETAKTIQSYGVSCQTFCFDAGDYSACQAMFDSLTKSHMIPDLVVNNAGIAHIGLFTDMTPNDWQHILQSNLLSVMNICHLCLPAMVRKQSGRIINISSVWGNVGASCEAVYSASKGGINSFTKALAKEMAPSHIAINAIACGAVDTEMNQCLTDEDRMALIDEIPACRMATPEEIGKMVLLLANAPDYLTGQIITVDGGWI